MYILGKEEVEAACKVVESGRFFRYRGTETSTFEKEWSEKIGVKHTIAMTSGTASLISGLVGLGVGPGDEVILPAYTYIATALAPLAVGAVPILAEIDESLTIDPQDVERKLTPRTRAIIPVHMCGVACNMEAIMELAQRHHLMVLEDACQASGGTYQGKMLGSIGDAGCFSFNQFKIISCGEGGALVTSRQEVYERALVYHDSACFMSTYSRKLRIPNFAGMNFRINELLSAILRVQFTRLDGILSALCAEKRLMMKELEQETAFTLNPIHDVEGDCSTILSLLFESPEKAASFSRDLLEENLIVDSPLRSYGMVYTQWEPLMQHRGAHHPACDALKLTKFPVTYSQDMCPKTLSILGRTLHINVSITRSQEETMDFVGRIKKVAQSY